MNVTESVKKQLALRSGNRCAMPMCNQPLSVDQGGGVVMVGEVAHIAGEHGGKGRGRPSARYDPRMSDEERNSISNLLFLCRICHAKIDAIPHGEQAYPVSLLREIKASHEESVVVAMREAMASVGFPELEKATQWVTESPLPPLDLDLDRIPLEAKIRKHELSAASQNAITAHLAAAHQVRSFIKAVSQDDATFPSRLKSGFLEY